MENHSGAQQEVLINRIAGGDKEALGILYNDTKSSVYGFALSIVQNMQDAEDVLQDTFVSIFSSACYYKKMGKPMAWILTIARNTALMKIRSRKKTADIPEEEWNLFIADDKQIPSEEKVILTAALHRLSAEERQIVMLHAVSGFKHKEIAKMLGLGLSTVLSKYNRSLKKLKSYL